MEALCKPIRNNPLILLDILKRDKRIFMVRLSVERRGKQLPRTFFQAVLHEIPFQWIKVSQVFERQGWPILSR